MKLVGPNSPGPNNFEIGGGKPVNHRVLLQWNIGTGADSLFVSNEQIYDVYIGNLAFQGDHNQQFWDQPSGTLYASEFHSLTFFGLKHVFGRPGAKALMTQVVFSGHWTDTAFQGGTQFTIGGSDNEFWVGGYCNLHGNNGSGDWSMDLNGCSKTNIGRIYLTAQGGWRGIRVRGNCQGLTFFGTTIEGRNANTPAPGSLMQIENGTVTLIAPWLAYAMSDPSAHGGGNNGVVQVTGGNVLIDRPYYTRANSVSESTPLIHASGGSVTARSAAPAGFTGKPYVLNAGGTVVADETYTVV